MKKTKYLFIICCIIIINFFFWNVISYKYDGDMNLQMSVFSTQNIDFQVFYTKERLFTEEKSKTITYVAGNEEILNFQLPSDIKYIRIDFGNMPLQLDINRIVISVGNVQKEISEEIANKFDNVNMLKLISKDETIEVKTLGDDPYIVFATDELQFASIIEQFEDNKSIIRKISICLIFDLACLVLYINRKKVSIILKEIMEKRSLIFDLAINDFKTKYAGSYLGVIWAFVQPTVTILVYWFVFQVGFRSGSIEGVPFVLWLMAGLVPWFFFNEALNSATVSLLDYGYLVKKVVFNINIIPIVRILSSLFVHVFFVLFMLCMFLLNGFNPCLEWIQLIYYSICLVAFVIGITYMTSSLVVFFRDLAQIIIVILQVLMWVTPIMWNWEIMPQGVQFILKLNPLYYIVQGYRNAMIYHEWFWSDTYLTIYFWIVAAICIIIGNKIFNKVRVHFADVI